MTGPTSTGRCLATRPPSTSSATNAKCWSLSRWTAITGSNSLDSMLHTTSARTYCAARSRSPAPAIGALTSTVWVASSTAEAMNESESYRVSPETSLLGRMGSMGRPSRFSPEVRERAVRMVEEHREAHASEWAVLQSVAPKLGCTAETLRKWVRQAQRDAGHRPGLTTSERERLKELEREVRELKRANEILRKAFAYFAQAELDRRRT